MKPAVLPGYIEMDDRGRAWVVDTNTRVDEIVLNKLAWGWDADEIARQYPHLPLAKIHAAFAYYYDHKDEVDRQIREDEEYVEEFFRNQPETPFERRLRDLRESARNG
jgi:uncharacterized protein (DUF433 family)